MAHNQIIEKAPALAPGCDFFTRSIRGPFIDTGVDIEANTPLGHRIYVCEDTVGEWASKFGWISPERAVVLKEATLVAREAQEEAEAELESLRHVVRALTAAGFRIPSEDEVPEDEITEFPHHKGAGHWLLSNGEQIRGSREKANDAEADIAEAEEADEDEEDDA